MLQHEPRSVSPQGKQNIYFTCHPDDFKTYFEKIYNDIRKFSNCIVWYSTEEDYKNDDITLLEKMNLFVVPITTKLLTNPCRAMKIDVPYAQNKTKPIPILPLMEENGLDESFYKNFKDIQYLAPNSKDNTAITYEEKLKKYLNSVFICDELTAKIRAAFNAYIFLSYRKKDREYANKLMRFIHQNDFCRDIAIWYDEYLVPGENFNNAISKAIEKSELFTMVVTPNLINEENYVKNDEYPAALHRKKILPVEMKQTNHDLLIEQYPEIPNCIDGYNSIELSNALQTSLLEIASRENDNDPQHNFFIGLAYLNGIDVEINNERALNLITSAAEAKENTVPEAIEKLVSMYNVGQGVDKDYNLATEWQRKLVKYWQNKYKKSRAIEDYKKLFAEFRNLGDQFYDLKILDSAENVYKHLINICNQSPKTLEPLETMHNLSICYNSLGDVSRQLGNLKKAEHYYQKDLALYKSITKEMKTVETQLNLSISYERLGDIYKDNYLLETAEEYYKKCLNIREHVSKDNSFANKLRSLIVVYDRLGEICKLQRTQKKYNEAEQYFRKSLSLCEQLVEENRTIESRTDLSISYGKLGEIQADQKIAEKYYRKSLALIEQLAEETNSVEARHFLSVSYSRIGNLCKSMRNLKEAEEFYRKNHVLCKQLVRETNTIDSRRNLALSYCNFGDLYMLQNNYKLAEKFYNKDLFLCEQLVKEKATILARRDLSVSYERLGNFYKEKGDPDRAEYFFKKNLFQCKKLQEETNSIELKVDLIISYEHLGDVYKEIFNLKLAKVFYKKAFILCKELVSQTATIEAKQHLSICYTNFGDVYREMKKLQKAKSFFLKDTRINEQIVSKNQSFEIKRDLSICYEKLGDIYSELRKNNKAKKYYSQCIVLCEELAKEKNTDETLRDLAVSYDNLGLILNESGSFIEAEKLFRQSLNIRKTLIKKHTSNKHTSLKLRCDLLVSYNRLGYLYNNMNNLKQAKIFYKKCLVLCEEIVKETKNDVNADDNLVDSYINVACIQEPYNSNMLEKAIQINNKLMKKCPEVVRFAERSTFLNKLMSECIKETVLS